MARKILISFLGVGPDAKGGPEARDVAPKREYNLANYRFGDYEKKTAFIAAALGEILKIDTYYLFGTMKSIWEEVYRHFAEEKNGNLDKNYHAELADICGNVKTNHSTPLNPNIFKKLAETLGNGSKVIPIHYGLNEKEIKSNFEAFVNTFEDLNDGDELYLDITHSFRSLPLFATTAISLIQDISGKSVQLKGIYYGMLEVTRELENTYAPIVELSYILDLQKWIKGAYAFDLTGNAQLIVELLKEENKTAAQKLDGFSRCLSLNFMHEIKSQIAVLKTLIKRDDYQLPAKLIVPEAFRKFVDFFKQARTLSDYQFLLAKWHFKKNSYALSFLCLVEAIISYHLERKGYNEDQIKAKVKREKAKGEIINDNSTLKDVYTRANEYRRAIAHVTEESRKNRQKDKSAKINMTDAIEDLKKFIDQFKTIKQSRAY